jgi:type VI secretion system protein ImpA
MIENRRTGPISYRSYAIATGEIRAREGEAGIELAMIEKAMAETDLPVLIDQRRQFEILQEAAQQIRQVCLERGGPGVSVSLERLIPLTSKIVATLDAAVARRDPSAALAQQGAVEGSGEQPDGETRAAGRASVGRVTSAAEAAAALAGVAEYFSRAEPSNPALLLIRQAQQLVGKSFLEVMRALVPEHVPQAVINIGKDKFFGLPIEQLSSVVQKYESAEAAADADAGPDDAEPEHDDAGQDDAAHDEQEADPNAATDVTEDGNEQADGSDSDPAEEAPAVKSPPAVQRGNGPIAAVSRYRIKSRSEALALLEAIGAHFRNAEPSSPIPFLADRARDLALRDFLSVLSALLPEDALKPTNPGGGSSD